MTAPRRFTTFSEASPEGRLLAAGKAEYPNDAALRRAAVRLGLPAVVVGTAAAAATATSTTASATSAATASASTALPSASSTILTATFLKATVVGVAIGVGTIGTADLAFRNTAPQAAVTAPAAIAHAQPRARHAQQPQPMQAVAAAARSSASPTVSATEESSELPAVSEPVAGNKGHSTFTELRQSARASQPQPAAVVAGEVPTADFDRQSRSLAPSADPKTHLASEVESLDRARAAVSRGDASGALRELDDYASHQPYRLLAGEVILVRIEALLALGDRAEAAALARQLLKMGAPAPQRARLERLARLE